MGLEMVEGVVTNPRDSVIFCLLCLVLFFRLVLWKGKEWARD